MSQIPRTTGVPFFCPPPTSLHFDFCNLFDSSKLKFKSGKPPHTYTHRQISTSNPKVLVNFEIVVVAVAATAANATLQNP